MTEVGPTCTDHDKELSQSRGPNRKLLIGSLVIVAAIAYLVVSSLGGAAAYYLTVSELQAQGPSASGNNVRVSGLIQQGSIEYDPTNLLLTFEVADDTGTLPVIYKGVRPDMFQDGAEAVIEGRYEADGRFRASSLMLKCPSKYEEAAASQAPGA